MNPKLCRYLGWSATPAVTQGDLFCRTMSLVAVVAGVAHLIFLILFATLGVYELAALNVLSLATYAVAVWRVHQRPFLIEALMGLEIVLHGLVSVYLIGWDSGFHFYIMLIVPIAVVSGGVNDVHGRAARWIGGVGAALLYLWMDAFLQDRTPVHILPVKLLAGLRLFNLAGTLVILGVLALVFRQLILQAESVLRHQACTDPLTQLHNRRSALDVVQREVALFARQARPLAVILCDVDHFKAINDKHGHHVGDQVLQSVSQVLLSAVRQMDHVARWGGEEFLVVLPGTEIDEAYRVAERLRAQVAASVCQAAKGPIPITMTVGLADLRVGETVDQLISRADQALYRGKQSGRNQVVIAP